MDPRTPVIVGAAQRTYREDPPPPLDQMEEMAREAAGPLLERIERVATVDAFSWPVPRPSGALADRLGIAPRDTVRSARGGNGPLALLGEAAGDVAAGRLDVALIAGGEAVTRFRRAMEAGEPPEAAGGDGPPDRVLGTDRDASHPLETEAGLIAPIFFYPLIEHAHRAAAGRAPDEHVAWLSRWWARFSDVAAGNEHAWSRERLTAEQIATPGDGNRLVSSPYTKVMNANITVDQAAALVVCSAEAAAAAGVPRDRWVFVHGSAGGAEHWFVGERPQLHRSPVLRRAYEALGAPDAEHVDVYSCFPSAVQTGALELGLDLERDTPTVTGGLAFFGGPANNYTTHSVATLVGRLRERPGRGLATAVGWYLTKHQVVALGSEPAPFRSAEVEPEDEPVEIVARLDGAPVEAYTALYDRDGTPSMGIVSVRDGARRAFAKSHDPDAVAALLDGDPIGEASPL